MESYRVKLVLSTKMTEAVAEQKTLAEQPPGASKDREPRTQTPPREVEQRQSQGKK